MFVFFFNKRMKFRNQALIRLAIIYNLEALVLGRLCCCLESEDLVSPAQAGFRPGGSAVDQVLLLS